MKYNKSYTCLVQIEYPYPTGHTNKLTRVVTIPDFPCPVPQDDEDCLWEETLMDNFLIQLKAMEVQNFLKCINNRPDDYTPDLEDIQILRNMKATNGISMLYRIRFKATSVITTVIEHIQNPIDHTFESEVLIEEFQPFKKSANE